MYKTLLLLLLPVLGFSAGITVTPQYTQSSTGLGNVVLQTTPSITTPSISSPTLTGTTVLPGSGEINTSGRTGIGTATTGTIGLLVGGTLTSGSTQRGIYCGATFTSTATSNADCIVAAGTTDVAAFNVGTMRGVRITTTSLGSGSSVTTFVGVDVNAQTIATNNYGIRSSLASGSTNYNLYLEGTAQNYLNGSTYIGYTGDQGSGEKMQINGALAINSATLVHTLTAFTNGAGASAGTLTNAPSVGNPTKWIPVNDNGTTRYIPSW